ncbi:MAG TPA: DNA repair protein RecO [Pseudogracilibacillus sp.]|nr:DNA repair protein RecO [Pseudogracilibacillus sp.]
MLERMEGIVLRSQNYGETHKIITLFTKERGLISAICRGANKGKSRLSAISQPFIHGQFLIYVSKGLSTVQQGEIVHSFRSIREDIVKTAYAAYLAEFTHRTLEEKKRILYLYNELLQTFHWINEHDEYAIPVIMFELKLFQYGGYSPVLKMCVNCSTENNLTHFSIREGGVLCSTCWHMDDNSVLLNSKLIYILQVLSEAKLEQVGQINMKASNIQLLQKIMDEYYDSYGGAYLKSKRFLSQIDHLM